MQKWLLAVTVVLATMVGFTAQAESLPNTMLFTNLSGQEVEWPKELPGKKTVILLAYKRGQQSAVEDWVAQMGFSPSDNFIQVLLMGRGARFVKGMIDGGLKAAITCLDPSVMPEHLAGYQFGPELLEQLPGSVDPCGENGEFHTFAWDGPMFKQPIPVMAGEVVNRDGFVYADLLLEESP